MHVYCNLAYVCTLLRKGTFCCKGTLSNKVRNGTFSQQFPSIGRNHLDDNVRHKYDDHTLESLGMCCHKAQHPRCMALALSKNVSIFCDFNFLNIWSIF